MRVEVLLWGGKSLVRKLLKPYLTFSVIAIICFCIWGVYNHADWLLITERNLYKTITGYGIMAIWFIPSYFIGCYVFFKTYHCSFKFQAAVIFTEVVIGIVASSLFSFLKTELSSSCYEIIYYPSAAVLRGVACAFFITSGKLIYDMFTKIVKTHLLTESSRVFLVCVVGLTSLVLNILLSRYNDGTNFSLMKLGQYPYMVFANGVLGALWVIALFYLLKDFFTFRFLQFVGRKSLVIMGTHMSLLLTILVPAILGRIIGQPAIQTPLYYLFGVLCVGFIMLLELPVIKLFDGALKPLISKF